MIKRKSFEKSEVIIFMVNVYLLNLIKVLVPRFLVKHRAHQVNNFELKYKNSTLAVIS